MPRSKRSSNIRFVLNALFLMEIDSPPSGMHCKAQEPISQVAWKERKPALQFFCQQSTMLRLLTNLLIIQYYQMEKYHLAPKIHFSSHKELIIAKCWQFRSRPRIPKLQFLMLEALTSKQPKDLVWILRPWRGLTCSTPVPWKHVPIISHPQLHPQCPIQHCQMWDS